MIYHYTMALNIKDPTTERLAAEVAELTADSKTGAIRTSLEERLRRLRAEAQLSDTGRRLHRFLVDEAWPQIPVEVRGTRITKDERESILGIGPEGV